MIVCKKLNEEISRNIIVAHWDTCGRLKGLWWKVKVQKTLMIILRLNLMFYLLHKKSYCYYKCPLKYSVIKNWGWIFAHFPNFRDYDWCLLLKELVNNVHDYNKILVLLGSRLSIKFTEIRYCNWINKYFGWIHTCTIYRTYYSIHCTVYCIQCVVYSV